MKGVLFFVDYYYMKNQLLSITSIFPFVTGKSAAQDTIPSVEQSIMGFQIGESGLVFNYELKLARQFSLRTEAGITLAFYSKERNIWTGEEYKSATVALPSFTVEPRWYYNLNRRMKKGKDITRNRANYISLMVNYAGGWGAIKPSQIDDIPDFIHIIPTYGVRRTLGEHFNYELGGGIGYTFTSGYNHYNHKHRSEDKVLVYLRARFGFDF